ncbi:MAG: phosphatase PAP2 family protein [Devosia sp.]
MDDLSRRLPFGANGPRWWLAAVGALAVLALSLLLDHTLSVWAQGWPPLLLRAMQFVTQFGESDWILWPSLLLFAVTALMSRFVAWKLMRLMLLEQAGLFAFIFAGVGVPNILSSLAKGLVGRAQAEHFDEWGLFGFHVNWDDWILQSFPSAHATTAFALAAVLGFLSVRWFVPGLVLAIVVALSRVALGFHSPSDVLAGAVLGLLGAYWMRSLFGARKIVFQRLPDGTVRRRPPVALQRYVALKRRGSARAQR